MVKKAIAILMLFLLVVFLFWSIPVHAHSGGTDGRGGHIDQSTGKYHYHHGHPAHQHKDGVCPYEQIQTDEVNDSDPFLPIALCLGAGIVVVWMIVRARKKKSQNKNAEKQPDVRPDITSDEEENKPVFYYVKSGNTYHADKNCTILRRSKSILSVRSGETSVLCWRHPCRVCCDETTPDFFSVVKRGE